jgi:hypothetical protein
VRPHQNPISLSPIGLGKNANCEFNTAIEKVIAVKDEVAQMGDAVHHLKA